MNRWYTGQPLGSTSVVPALRPGPARIKLGQREPEHMCI